MCIRDRDLSKIAPGEVAARIKQPVLLFHGDQDEEIVVSHGQRIAKQLKHPQSEFVIIKGAGHRDLMSVGYHLAYPKIRSFISSVR